MQIVVNGKRCAVQSIIIFLLQPLLLNGCGLLVCTVPYLYRLLQLEIDQKQKLFDKNRIKHLVIDDIDQIVGRFSNELNFVRKSLCPRGRNGETDVQVCIYICLPLLYDWKNFSPFF